jgi:hypothetical protein
MGYRSVVDAVFYTRNEEEAPLLKLYVDENFPRNEELRECLTPIKAPKVWGYHFIADNIKWYESYTFVKEFNEFVVKFNQLLTENERARPTWAFEFVRLGEDTSDIEEERSDNADFILSVSREVQLMP